MIGFCNVIVGKAALPLKAVGENPFLSLSIFWWLQVFLVLCPCHANLFPLVIASPSRLCLETPTVSRKDTCDDI